jgi:hypothetical protein
MARALKREEAKVFDEASVPDKDLAAPEISIEDLIQGRAGQGESPLDHLIFWPFGPVPGSPDSAK